MLNAVFLLAPEDYPKLYSDEVRARLRGQAFILGGLVPSAEWTEHRDTLSKADVIFSGWGAPVMDDAFIQSAPRLKAVFYAGGSVRYFVTNAFWQRGVRVTSALSLNAIPVSEYTASVILLGLKRFWHYAHETRAQRNFQNGGPITGAYRSTVGLISYGTIARLVRQRLADSEIRVLVYDPFLTEAHAQRDNVELASLDEVFSLSDAVSLHAPLRDETTGLITGRHFDQMKPGSLFVNTARGEIVNEPEMIASLRRRPDLQVVLDVTSPEPPLPDSPLYQLPNVVLTPHIAGSLGAECRRMGHAMIDEFERFLRAEPLNWELTPEMVALMA